jgi:hypothetical protein
MKKWYRDDKVLYPQLVELLRDIYATLGLQPRLIAPIVGRYIYWAMQREDRRLASGWTIEPKTFLEKNLAAQRESISAKPKEKTPADLPTVPGMAGLKQTM